MKSHEIFAHYQWMMAQIRDYDKQSYDLWDSYIAMVDGPEKEQVYATYDALRNKSRFLFNESIEVLNAYQSASAEEMANLGNVTSAGRPKIGIKRTVSLTLTQDDWDAVDAIVAKYGGKVASVVRDLVLQSLEVQQIKGD